MREPRVPHDPAAEEALVGAMLIDRSVIEDALPILPAEDFYVPKFRKMYAAMAQMHAEGVEIDAVTLSGTLTARGDLEAVGGDSALVEVLAGGGYVASAKAYANRIVRCAQYRKLIASCTDVMHAAFEQSADPGELVEILGVRSAELLGSDVVEAPSDLWTVDDFLDRPEIERPGWVIPGLLRNGWRVMVVAAEGVGKALPLDTVLPTPDGWTTMGEVAVGDEVFAMDGTRCRVRAVHPVNLRPESYRVRFSDGTEQLACADHLWSVIPCEFRQPHRRGNGAPLTWPTKVISTAEIRDTLRVKHDSTLNYAVPVAGPLRCEPADLAVDPYVLGVWLGDGNAADARITLADRDAEEILAALVAAGETPRVNPSSVDTPGACRTYGLIGTNLPARLRHIGVLGAKHIPSVYLRASVSQREALLRGMLDTDGTCRDAKGSGRGSGSSRCELTFTEERLARGAVELVRSLGMSATITESEAHLDGRYISQRWRIRFTPDRQVFGVRFKADRVEPLRTHRSRLRYIESVEPVEPVPMRCITVDSPDGTYLCGDSMVPTHNTTLMRQIGMAAAQGIHPFRFHSIAPCRTLIVDLENPDDSIVDVCNPIRSQVRSVSRDDYDPDRAWLWHRPGGINLRQRRDRSEFEAVLATVRPSLVCLGPIYKCYRVEAREQDEQAAADVMAVFDDLRTRYGFALMMEHHAPKGGGGSRDLMPYGSSLWLRWPEIGLKLDSEDEGNQIMQVGRWRGDRLENEWPNEIHRSRPWPWRAIDPRRPERVEAFVQEEPFRVDASEWWPTVGIGKYPDRLLPEEDN